MRDKLKSTRTTIICCIIIGVLLIGLSVYAAFAGTEGWLLPAENTTPAPTEFPTPTEAVLPSEGDMEALVLVLEVEKEQNRIAVYEPDTDRRYDLFYTGTTDLRDRFGAVISGTQIARAAIAKVSFDAGTKRLYSLTTMEPDWRYELQSLVEIEPEKGMLTVAGNNYRIGENPVILETGEEIAFSELASVDELTVCGMGDRVFFIERTKGHGILELLQTEAFSGGIFYIDGKAAETVTENMKMTMREGEYRFALEKDEIYAEKTLLIQKDEIKQWDLSEYMPEEPKVGRVEFMLEPEDGQLYVDSSLYENKAFADLTYGEHVIGFYKDGYIGWTGKITVSSEEMLFSVSLVLEPPATPTPESVPSPTAAPEEDAQGGQTPTQTPEADETNPSTDSEQTNQSTGEDQTQTPTDVPEAKQDKRTVQIIWYPTSVVSVDSVYVGTTDAAGILETELMYGTHVVELTRVQLGNTMPKKFTVDIHAQSSVLNFLLEN